jgi:hypothetical protein
MPVILFERWHVSMRSSGLALGVLACAGCQWLLGIDTNVPMLHDAGASDATVPMSDASAADSGLRASDDADLDARAPVADSGADARVDDASDEEGEAGCVPARLDADPRNCGSCGHDCLGGDCAGGACQPIVLARDLDAGTLQAIAIDDTSVYWGDSSGVVGVVAKSGGDGRLLLTNALDVALSIAVDTQRLYVGTGRGVYAFNKDGSGQVTVSPAARAFNLVVEPQAIDWTDPSSPDGDVQPSLVRAPFGPDGGFLPLQVVASNLWSLSVASDGSNVFWVSNDAEQALMRTPLDGGVPAVVACHGPDYPSNQMVVDSTDLAWIGSGYPNVWTASKDDGAPLDGGCAEAPTARPRAATHMPETGALALTSRFAIWTEFGPGNVKAVVLDGSCTGDSCVRTLATNRNQPYWIVADERAAYWVEWYPQSIVKVAF